MTLIRVVVTVPQAIKVGYTKCKKNDKIIKGGNSSRSMNDIEVSIMVNTAAIPQLY